VINWLRRYLKYEKDPLYVAILQSIGEEGLYVGWSIRRQDSYYYNDSVGYNILYESEIVATVTNTPSLFFGYFGRISGRERSLSGSKAAKLFKLCRTIDNCSLNKLSKESDQRMLLKILRKI